MSEQIVGKRGGYAATAKRFEDTVINAQEAAALLRRATSKVRAQAEAGELPVLGWDGSQPYFKAGTIMDLAGNSKG